MKNKKNFSTRGFNPLLKKGYSPILLLIFLFLIFSKSQSPAYWHQVFNFEALTGTSVCYNVVGDSSNLYIGYYKDSRAGQCGVLKSTDLGKTWTKIFNDPYINGLSESPFRFYVGLRHPAPGYMYLLYSSRSGHTGTGIKRFDERAGKIVDSTVISHKSNWAGLRNFSMYDSLNGLFFYAGLLSITRDGWKSCKQYNYTEGTYNGDSTEYYYNYTYYNNSMKMLSPNTVFFYGTDEYGSFLDTNYNYKNDIYGFHKMTIGKGDSTFTFEALGDGVNIEITEDSTHKLTYYSAINTQKRPSNFAYINDRTWLYVSGGKKTGYGSTKTLEIFKTINRGKSFYQVCMMDIGGHGLSRIEFKDELHGLAVGNSAVLRTSDGGETWTADLDEKFYQTDWKKDSTAHWNIHISYVDGMSFLGMYNVGVYKYEDSIDTGVQENIFMNNTLLYPNPIQAGKILNFKIPQLISGRAFIYDIYGNKVDELNFFGNSIQLTNDIVAGTYFLVIGDMNEKIIMRSKFIVK